jgi:predicted ferric reductase
MNPKLLIAVYLAMVLLPLVLSWVSGRPPRSFWDELAGGAGMLAFAIILAEFLLSGRFHIVSRRIGMDVTMRFHQLLARTALVFALIHPFLYRAPSNPQLPWDPNGQLTLSPGIEGIATGLTAWVLLIVLVALGIGRTRLDYRYETWRLMHGAGALLISGLLLHHTLSARDFDNDPWLIGSWIALFCVAVLSLLYVYLVKPLGQLHRPWRVSEVQPLSLKTWEVTIEPDDHEGLNHTAGQFCWLNIGHSPLTLHENRFSISSAPYSGPSLQFVIKELGDFTGSIMNVQRGTRAYVDARMETSFFRNATDLQ